MAVIRVNKDQNYTVMSNYHFKEKDMSLKAKGLLSLMLSLPNTWDYSIAGLVAICKENETSIKTTLDELKEFGYLTITKKMPNETESGRIKYQYDIYEKPQKQASKKQGVENLGVEFLGVENQGQLNTNKLNTKNNNKERKKTKYDEIINGSINDKDVKELIYEFIKMRTLKKKPLTDRALTIQLNKLLKLSNDIEIQKKIIEKSIIKCWDEFYPYKEENFNTNNTNNSNTGEVKLVKLEGGAFKLQV